MNDSGFVSHCLELLSPLGRTSSRRMFGGQAQKAAASKPAKP